MYMSVLETKNIRLFNRDRLKVELIPLNEDRKYLLDTESQYISIGYDQNNAEIMFIDPSGGPLLCIGKEVDKIGIISKIYQDSKKGYIICFRD